MTPNIEPGLPKPEVFVDVDFKFRRFLRRNLPHKTRSGHSWCIPVWLVWLTGGNYDSGNGYGWRPNIIKHIQRYYKQHWNTRYSLYQWIFK